MPSFSVRSTRLGAVFAALTVLALSSSGAQAQDFEGVITMRATGASPDGQPLPDLEYMARGGKLRLNVRSPMGAVGIIAVPSEKKMYTVLDAQRMYIEAPYNTDGGSVTTTGPAPVITRTGRKETIAGYECEHLLVVSGKDSSDVCMARGLGSFFLANMGGARRMPAWQQQLMAERAFPLKVVSGGKTQFEVTKIERRKLTDALFDVPDSYQKMDMPTRRPPGQR